MKSFGTIAVALIIVLTSFGFAIEKDFGESNRSVIEETNIKEETSVQLNNRASELRGTVPGSRVWIEGTRGWAQTGDSLYPNDNAWWVGIGTASPDEKLDVRGTVLGHGPGGTISGVSSTNRAGIFGVTGMSVGAAAGYGAVSGFMQSTSGSHAGLYGRVYDNATGLIVDRITGSGDIARFKAFGNPDVLIIKNSGNVGIGTSSPGWLLECNGDAAKPGGGSWSNSSDRRLKNIHRDFIRGLDAIVSLRPVYYSYKEDNPLGLPSDKQYVGLVAQEVEHIIPEAIDRIDRDGYLYLNNDPIIWTILNAVKELKAENDNLKVRIRNLEQRLGIEGQSFSE